MRLCLVGVLVTLLGVGHADIEVEPWHMQEDAELEAQQQPLIIKTTHVHYEQRKRASDGPFFHNASEQSEHLQRQRRDPRPGSLYWYNPLFRPRPETKLGPERPHSNVDKETPHLNSYTVAVYYYPWYHTDFHGRKYIRGELDPPQLPALGEYDDRDEKVISQHLEWSRQANIDLWVASWWGPDSGTDITIRDYILKNRNLKDMKFCLFYETMGRIDTDTLDTSKVYDDITYAALTYFGHPNYHEIDGRPVVFVYLTRVLERLDLLREVISLIRTAAFQKGHFVYIVGDHSYGSPPEGHLDALDWLDAVTNYDIFGGMGRPNGHATMAAVKEYSAEQAQWRIAAAQQGCAYIPGATPGYNDKAVRQGEYNAMSRKIDKGQPDGSLFRALLTEGKKLVDKSTGNLLIVNSFNEWHEDTQIEPAARGGMTYKPWYLTRGYVYQGYGEKFLNILAQETAMEPHSSLIHGVAGHMQVLQGGA